MRVLLFMPWPSHSQERLLPSSMMAGCWAHTSAFSSTLARMPWRSNTSIMRNTPTRDP